MLSTTVHTSVRRVLLYSNALPEHFCKLILTSSTRSPIPCQVLSASCSQPRNARNFSSSPRQMLKDVFPEPQDAPNIRTTKPAWPHPVYTEEQVNRIKIAHREAKTWSDWFALGTVRLLRWGLDKATGYKHDPSRPFAMSEKKYLIRNVFLESVAGVPGMVAGMLRHLHSMRRMRRDNGWMETLLEESYNERMHLLTFLKMAEPGLFMRVMVLATQGVFFNGFFVAYLISPATCHRFVGYLEEEAVTTYTREIEDLDAGLLPKWEKMSAPSIAINYWELPEGRRTIRDMLLQVRADEAKHREVNHTLGNLDQKNDPNPFVSQYKDETRPHPEKGVDRMKPSGWERSEAFLALAYTEVEEGLALKHSPGQYGLMFGYIEGYWVSR